MGRWWPRWLSGWMSGQRTSKSLAEVVIKAKRKEDPKGHGRTSPVLLRVGYRPHGRVHNGDGTYLGVAFVDVESDAAEFGVPVKATIQFIYEPKVCYDHLFEGSNFAILEGGNIVGTGSAIRRLVE